MIKGMYHIGPDAIVTASFIGPEHFFWQLFLKSQIGIFLNMIGQVIRKLWLIQRKEKLLSKGA